MTDEVMPALAIREVIDEAFLLKPEIVECAIRDIKAVFDRDPAVHSYLTVLIHFKGFQSIQVHRLAHYLWERDRRDLALFISKSQFRSIWCGYSSCSANRLWCHV